MSKNIAVNSLGQVVFGNVASFGMGTNGRGFIGVSVETRTATPPVSQRNGKKSRR